MAPPPQLNRQSTTAARKKPSARCGAVCSMGNLSDRRETACASRLLNEIQGALKGALLVLNLFLELENCVEQGFRARRAAGDVNVHRDDLIATLHDGVVVENAARSGAGPHGNDPFGLGHLIVELTNHGGHLL